MDSFVLRAVGHLRRNPEIVARGDTVHTRFCLVGHDYADKDEEGDAREIVTAVWFVASGPLGEALWRHSRKGDQLFVKAHVRQAVVADPQGVNHSHHDYVVTGFHFGAVSKFKGSQGTAPRSTGASSSKTSE